MHQGKRLLPIAVILILALFIIFTFLYKPRTIREKKTPPDTLSNWIVTTIPSGGSLYSVLSETGLPMQEIGTFAIQFGENIDVTTIQPGDTLKVKLTPDKSKIEQLVYIQEIDEQHHFYQRGDSLLYKQIQLPVETKTRLLKGTLHSTLDQSLLNLGLNNTEKQIINNGLEGEVNFRTDARNGDEFQVLLEERYLGNIRLPRSKILYVSYKGKLAGSHELFHYQDIDEKSTLNGLYTREGKCSNTNGVRYPLNRIHVVSKFGRRIDPIYKTWRMHQGIDYKASYGTPVYAVASGSVTYSGWNGGYGKTIKIKHANGYTTLYAHLSSIGVKRGQKVNRGQIIGRVGSTGKSTGAHLHFGLIKGSKYINPTNLKMVGAEKLNAKQMNRFEQQKAQILELLKQTALS
jgi:murein DD-endopeptidase MepM/ murein hydrolase activator NlpD